MRVPGGLMSGHVGRARRLARLGLFCLPGSLAMAPAAAQVMTTSGDFSVDDSGAAHFEVPILVPPGSGGMVPSISLSYSSQAPNGIGGPGWAVEGLSMITRCPRDMARDGERRALAYDLQDQLCLDGQRLVLVSATPQIAGALYRTEVDGLSRVEVLTADASGPLSFRVSTKSGVIMTYGGTANARIPTPGAPAVRAWAVDDIRDTVNNYMSISYYADSGVGEYRPDRIDYGGNDPSGTSSDKPHYASVRFIYNQDERSDPIRQYSAGGPAVTTKRLSSIRTYVGEHRVTDYQFTYVSNPATRASRPATLQRCGQNGTCLPPLTFTWSGSTPPGPLTPLTPVSSGWSGDGPNEAFLQFADVTGDGFNDGIKFNPGSGALNVYRNTGTGQLSAIPPRSFVAGGDPQSRDFAMVDLDLDGKSDAVLYNKNNGKIAAMLATSFGNFGPVVTTDFKTADGLPNSTNSASYHVDFNDYNNDGRPDVFLTVVRRSTDGGSPPAGSWVAYGTGTGGFGAPQAVTWALGNEYVNSNFYSYVENILSNDVDGDGRIDKTVIFHTRRQVPVTRTGSTRNIDYDMRCASTFVRTAGATPAFGVGQDNRITASGIKVCTTDVSPPGFENLETFLAPAGDLNADGLPDYYGYYRLEGDIANAKMAVLYGAGRGRLIAGTLDLDTRDDASVNLENSDFFFWSDVNADGLADFVIAYTDGPNEEKMDVHYARPSGSFYRARTNIAFTGNAPNAWVEAVDLDGDGIDEIVTHRDDSVSSEAGLARPWRQPNVAGAPPDRLLGITDGLGAQVKVTYDTLLDSAVYTKQNASYPQMGIIGPLWVVAKVETSDGLGGLRSTLYRYLGLKAEVNSRTGLLGFRQRITTRPDIGSVVTETLRQDWPYVGMVEERKTELPGTSPGTTVMVNKTTTNFACIDTASTTAASCGAATRRFFPYAAATVEVTRDLDGTALPTVTTTTIYDRYGNATRVKVETSDGYAKTTDSLYSNDESKWLLGRLTQTDVTAVAP